jgi:hypothetical protein
LINSIDADAGVPVSEREIRDVLYAVAACSPDQLPRIVPDDQEPEFA